MGANYFAGLYGQVFVGTGQPPVWGWGAGLQFGVPGVGGAVYPIGWWFPLHPGIPKRAWRQTLCWANPPGNAPQLQPPKGANDKAGAAAFNKQLFDSGRKAVAAELLAKAKEVVGPMRQRIYQQLVATAPGFWTRRAVARAVEAQPPIQWREIPAE